MSQRVTRKDAEYVAMKIAAIHDVYYGFKIEGLERDGEPVARGWFFDFVSQYGGGEIREWQVGNSGEWQPFGSQRRTPKEFFEWGNAYVKGALAFGGPEIRDRLNVFFEANPV